MTKKQVLFSLRERVVHYREVCTHKLSKLDKSSEDYQYYLGRIDSFELVLEMLSDYD